MAKPAILDELVVQPHVLRGKILVDLLAQPGHDRWAGHEDL